jgi:hypothetical protein
MVLLAVILGFLFWSITAGHWQGLSYQPGWLQQLERLGISWGLQGAELILVLALVGAHFGARKLAALSVKPWLKKQVREERRLPGQVIDAFEANTRSWRVLLLGKPLGWNDWSEGRIAKVLHDCEAYVQNLNERFTNPRGLKVPAKH